MLSTKNFFRNGISKSSQIVHDLFNVCQGMNTLNADWMKIIGDFTLLIVVIFVRNKSNRNNVLRILPVVRFVVVIKRILSKSGWLLV